ncbi:MAG: hypothetical protein Q4E77_05225 [Conchiformibius sp.]|nr:hypothetical protein [Conchiformibius sp.]
MKIPVTLKCSRCQGLNIKKNGFNGNRKQKYYCKICKRCFIGNHALNNKDCHSQSDSLIWRMSAYGNGIRAICAITAYSRDKVQAALKRSHHQITPKQKHYGTLQVDEFHIFVGRGKTKFG